MKPKNLICRIFGHRQPKGSTGKPYLRINHVCYEGNGQRFVALHTTCSRCGGQYHVANTHLRNQDGHPDRDRDLHKALEGLKRATAALKLRGSIIYDLTQQLKELKEQREDTGMTPAISKNLGWEKPCI